MKNDRQNKILAIIAREDIDTQEGLLERLHQEGIHCTQATISRDIKQLHLIKEPIGRGRYRYAVSIHRKSLNVADKLRNIFRECVVSIEFAQNIVVIKTIAGLAGAAAEAVDSMKVSYMVGSLAGENTVLLVMRDNEAAEVFCEEIKETLR